MGSNGIVYTSAVSSIAFQCRKKVEHAAFFMHRTVSEHVKIHHKRTRMHHIKKKNPENIGKKRKNKREKMHWNALKKT